MFHVWQPYFVKFVWNIKSIVSQTMNRVLHGLKWLQRQMTRFKQKVPSNTHKMRVQIILRMHKVLSGHLLSIYTFCSIPVIRLAVRKGRDQIARIHRLIKAFVVRIWLVFAWHDPDIGRTGLRHFIRIREKRHIRKIGLADRTLIAIWRYIRIDPLGH